MRSIAQFPNEEQARRFSFFLKKEGIVSRVDVQEGSFSLWVEDEDSLAKAKNYLEQWKSGKLILPEIKIEDTLPPGEETEEDLLEEEIEEDEETPEEETDEPKVLDQKVRSPKFPLTVVFFLLCALFYVINFAQTYDWNDFPIKIFRVTPIQMALLYDNPAASQEINQYLSENSYDLSKKLQEQPLKMQEVLQESQTVPVWRGLEFVWLEKSQKTAQNSLQVPMFEKILQGQIWRLVSPAFLHLNFWHILFNILWLWMLGKQIETRLSKIKYLVLVLILAVVTNTLQYLMSGFLFVGYSGVIMGLLGFIYMRQKVAPWEGYPLSKATILFVAFFILTIFAFQFFSFGLQIAGVRILSSNIGNTAHMSGGILGLILGRLPFFSRGVHER